MHRLCWEALIWKCGLRTCALSNCIFVSVSSKTRMDTWVVSRWVPFVFQQEEWCISITVSNLSCKGLFVQGKRRDICATSELWHVLWDKWANESCLRKKNWIHLSLTKLWKESALTGCSCWSLKRCGYLKSRANLKGILSNSCFPTQRSCMGSTCACTLHGFHGLHVCIPRSPAGPVHVEHKVTGAVECRCLWPDLWMCRTTQLPMGKSDTEHDLSCCDSNFFTVQDSEQCEVLSQLDWTCRHV